MGVFLLRGSSTKLLLGLPHVRGGVSDKMKMIVDWGDGTSSPRAWGCFRGIDPEEVITAVFPTCVGVFLFERGHDVEDRGLPHVRGGVSGR